MSGLGAFIKNAAVLGLLSRAQGDARFAAVNSGPLASVQAASRFELDCVPSQLAVLRTAITAGTANIAFAGDSNTEDGDNIDPALNLLGTHRQILQEQLQQRFPVVNWTFRNWGLRSRTLGAFASNTYVGQSGSEVQATGFLRTATVNPYWGDGTGSVVGKTWLNHVKDSAPDAIVMHFGLNPQLDSDFVTALDVVRTAIATWPKVPSVIIVAPMRPHPLYQDQYRPQRLGRLIRTYARFYGWALIDSCRIHNILRDGFDESAGNWRYYGAIDNTWSPDWVSVGGAVTAPDNFTRVFAAGAFLRLPINASDVSIQMTLNSTNTNVTGVPMLRVRDESQIAEAGTAPGPAWAQQSSFSAKLFDGVGEIATASRTAVNGDTILLRCEGSRMDLYLRAAGTVPWVKILTKDQWKNNAGGSILVGSFDASGTSTGGLVMTNPRVSYKEPLRMGKTLSDEQMLGAYNGGSLAFSLPYGGNGVNHPNAFGSAQLFGPGYAVLMRALLA